MNPNSKDLDVQMPFTINVVITEKNSNPSIELRRVTTDEELIKQIVSYAWHGQPIIVVPQFTNKLQAANALINKGILYKEKEQLYFTF